MNQKLFQKLNDAISNPVRKENIIVTEQDELNLIFGKESLSNILEEYTFDIDEFRKYMADSEKVQKKIDDKRREEEIERARSWLEKKKLKHEQKKAKKADEKEKADAEKKEKEAKVDAEIEAKISYTDLKNEYNREYAEINDDEYLKTLIKDAEKAVSEKNKESAKEILSDLEEYKNAFAELNRDPYFSRLNSSDKMRKLTSLPDIIFVRLRTVR